MTKEIIPNHRCFPREVEDIEIQNIEGDCEASVVYFVCGQESFRSIRIVQNLRSIDARVDHVSGSNGDRLLKVNRHHIKPERRTAFCNKGECICFYVSSDIMRKKEDQE